MRYNCLFCNSSLKDKINFGTYDCDMCIIKYQTYIGQCFDRRGLYEVFYNINYNEIIYKVDYRIIMSDNIIAMTINDVDIENIIIFSKDFETWSDIWTPDQVLAKMPMILIYS